VTDNSLGSNFPAIQSLLGLGGSAAFAPSAYPPGSDSSINLSAPLAPFLQAGSQNSLSFDGSNSYLQVPNSASLNITGPITLEAWVKTNSSTTIENVLFRGDWTQNAYSYDLQIQNGKVRMDSYCSVSVYSYAIGATTVSTGIWHHIAGVFDGSQVRVYLDGALDGSSSGTCAPASTSTILRIGSDNNIYYPYNFSGLIDEVRVTSGVLWTSLRRSA
jgi:hypothetical protein